MTSDDLHLIRRSVATIDADRFANTFYDTLFELAPEARMLFPSDLTEQRRKLMAELTTMVGMATSVIDGELDRFVLRARRLGARHVDYGVTAEHYALVGRALVATLAAHVPGWTPDAEAAWGRLFALVSATMQEGALAR